MSGNILQRLTRTLWQRGSSVKAPNDQALAPAQKRVVRLAEKLPPIYSFRPAVVRALYYGLEQPFSLDKVPMATVKNSRFDVNGRSHVKGEIGLRAYYPSASKNSDKQAALVYYHGGGCVIGSLATHDTLCRFVAEQTGWVVLSVDYRCAPEAKFPIPVEDAICAWNWICDNAEHLGIDMDKTGVGGDSAGAYLAASVCLQTLKPELKYKPKRMPAYQWLLYPMLDLRAETASYQRCSDGMLLTRDFMFYLRDHYLNNMGETHNPIASPLLTESLVGLPPSYMLTVQHDPLMDEGLSYVKRMQEQGCQVEHSHFDNCMHGFVSFAGVCLEAHQALIEATNKLKAMV